MYWSGAAQSKSESSIFGRKMTKSGAPTKGNFLENRENMFFTRIEGFWAISGRKIFLVEKFLVESLASDPLVIGGIWKRCCKIDFN